MAISVPDLGRLRRKVQAIASDSFRARIHATLAEEARRLIYEGFARSMSPAGEPWEPLKVRDGLPLLDTGRLRNSIQVMPTRTGIRALTNVVYAATHQYGRDAIPARPFFPEGELPQRWAEPFRRAVTSAMRQAAEH